MSVLLEAVRTLGRRLAYRDVPWPEAAAECERAGVDEWAVAKARAELGDDCVGREYDAAVTETCTPHELRVGITAGQLLARLSSLVAADPDVGSMHVLVSPGIVDVASADIGAVRQDTTQDSDYVVVLR